ncbi:hypothetical protein PENTCL1PPCAC_11374, partial [Pristionchus entomophagus]
PNFPQQNLGLNPHNVDLFNQQLQNFNQLPPQAFFDPLSIQQPITNIKPPTVITPSFVVPSPPQSSESYLGGIPPQSTTQHHNSRALTVKSFVGIEKSTVSTPTIPPPAVTPKEDSEQVRLIRKLLEETLAEERSEKMTTLSTTTTHPPTTQIEHKSSIESVAEFGVLDRLNLNETEKKAIVERVEELLRAEIARKLLSEVSSQPLSPATSPPPTHTSTTLPPSTTTRTTYLPSSSSSSPSSTISTTASSTSTTHRIEESTTTVPRPRTHPVPPFTSDPSSIPEKTQLKYLALKQKKSSQVGGRSIVRPVTISESIDEPVSRLRVNSVEKEIREAQPRLPTRYIHNTNKDFDEDLDLIDRSGGSDRRVDTTAAASLLTSARRITYPQEYDDIRVPPSQSNDFFQPATGAPLDLTDVYEDEEEGGLVDLDINQRRREQLRAIGTVSPFSLRTTARLFHEETTTSIPPSPPSIDPLNLETFTTPPFRNGRQQHRATKFEVLASDYRSRLGEAGDLGHILKRLSQNAYIALIESDGGKRIRHESRPIRARRNSGRH